MKLTKREKILVNILMILIFIYGTYIWIISPKIKEMNHLKEKIAKYQMTIDENEVELMKKKRLDEEFKILNDKILHTSSRYFPYEIQEKYILLLDKIFNETKLQSHTISFQKPEIKPLEIKKEKEKSYALKEFADTYKNQSFSTSDSISEDQNLEIKKMEINIHTQGSYYQITNFIDKINQLDKRMLVKNVNLVRDENNQLSATMIIEIYSIPMIHEENEKIDWPFKREYGKSNPFWNDFIKNTAPTKEEISFDFAINVKPITSDLPTLTLGKVADESRKTYVYADKNEVENVEIYFTQENDQYYYKYKTSREAYPKDESSEEFIPNENQINLLIFTHHRNGANDFSGANVKIFNETDKEVYVEIQEDDFEKPRIHITKKSGKVKIHKK